MNVHVSVSNRESFCDLISEKFVTPSYIFYFPGEIKYFILNKINKTKITNNNTTNNDNINNNNGGVNNNNNDNT